MENPIKSAYVRFPENEEVDKVIEETVNAIVDLKPVKKIKKYSKTILISGSFFLVTLLLSIVIAYSRSSNHGMGSYSAINRPFSNDVSKVPANFSGLALYGNVTSIDNKSFNYKIHWGILPKGAFLDQRDDLKRTPRGPIVLTFDSHTEKFAAGQIMSAPDILFTLKTGNPTFYPFDEYEAEFFLSGSWINPDTNETEKVPLSVSLMTNVEGWQVLTQFQDESRGSFHLITSDILMYRGPTQRFFSMFLSSLMWLLGGSVFWLAVTLCWRKRRVEPPTIAVATTMLFALPAVRNVQPGNPPIGCTSDFMAFFWALALVSSASLILILNYIKNYKAEYKNQQSRAGDLAPLTESRHDVFISMNVSSCVQNYSELENH
jgi:hypothetical protein